MIDLEIHMDNIQNIVLPEGWVIASARESWGERNSGVVLLIKTSLELDEEDQNWIYRSADKIYNDLMISENRKDPNRPERELKIKNDLLNCFSDVGSIYVREIPNEYYNLGEPWLIVTTKIGPIKIGWRKRVISISWKDSDVVKTADELFPEEDTTKDHQMIHAWTYEKAVEYLKILHS